MSIIERYSRMAQKKTLFASKREDTNILSPLVSRWNDLVGRQAVDDTNILTPLVSRWNDLITSQASVDAMGRAKDLTDQAIAQARVLSEIAAERSRAWAEIAAERAKDLSELASDRGNALAKQTGDALEVARAKFLETDTYDALKDRFPVVARLDNRKQTRRYNAALWILGASVGLAAVGTAAYVVVRRQLAKPAEDALVELPKSPLTADAYSNASYGAADTGAVDQQLAKALASNETNLASPIDSSADAEAAPIVGNIRTMTYHFASDVDELPAEGNRIYFTGENEAREAGFRAVHEHSNSLNSMQQPTA